MKRIGVVCTNPESGQYTAFDTEDLTKIATSYSAAESVVDLLNRDPERFQIEIVIIEAVSR